MKIAEILALSIALCVVATAAIYKLAMQEELSCYRAWGELVPTRYAGNRCLVQVDGKWYDANQFVMEQH